MMAMTERSMLALVQIEREVFEFAALPGGWWRLFGLAALIGVCYGVFWLYRREARIGASRGLRAFLAAVRCVVLLLLAVILLRPVLVTYLERTQPGQLVLLVDASASMNTVDDEVADGATRLERVERAFTEDDAALLRALAAENDLTLYHFAADVAPLPQPWLPTAAPDDATPGGTPPQSGDTGAAARGVLDDSATDFGAALGRVRDTLVGRPLAGVVLVSDGGVNRGLSIEDLTRLAGSLDAPVHTVGLGAAVEPPNARITNLAGPSAAPQGDPIELRVDLSAAGIAQTDGKVVLTRIEVQPDGTRAERTVAERAVTLAAGKPAEPILFELAADEAGDFLFEARLQVEVEEAFTDDNVRLTPVRVLDDQLRVLLVAGRPSYEYRYLTRLLERDRTTDLSCWLQSADERAVRDGNTVITALPREPQEIFSYDVILLLDPNPAEFDSAWALTARRFVDEFGGGLLYQAGTHFATRFLQQQRLGDLVGVLPVVPDPDAEVQLSEGGTFRTRATPLMVPEPTTAHPLITLTNGSTAAQQLWSALPGVWWSYPVREPKPLAVTLLAERERAQPLLAVQPVGGGRTAFLGFESTWRWRARAERYYTRFWVQLVRYLAEARRQQSSDRGVLVLERESVDVGSLLRIEVRVLDANFAPWHGDSVVAEVAFGDGSTREVSLRAIPGRDGWFGGRVAVEQEGPGVIRVPLPDVSDVEGEAALVAYFRAQRTDLEMQRLALDRDVLTSLASVSGGSYLPLAEVAMLTDLVDSAARTRVDRGAERDLWDSPWLLAVLAGLLGLEWGLRRRNYLL